MYRKSGITIRDTSPGSDAASAHSPHEMVCPISADARFTLSGFAACAGGQSVSREVSQSLSR